MNKTLHMVRRSDRTTYIYGNLMVNHFDASPDLEIPEDYWTSYDVIPLSPAMREEANDRFAQECAEDNS